MSNQILKIKVPPPEVGQNKARVSVINNCGESVEEVDYVYLEACEFPTIPEETDLSGIDDNELVEAYEECLEEIADLFCDVSTATPPLDVPTGPLPVVNLQIDNFRIPQADNLSPGSVFSFGFELFGTGNCTYEVFLQAGGEEYPITQGQFVESLNVYPGDRTVRPNQTDLLRATNRVIVPSGFFEIPEEIQTTTGVFVLRIKNSFDNIVVDILQVQFKQSTNIRQPLVLGTDNDPANSNREIYYLSNTVADINKTFASYKQDIADRRVNNEYITGDLFRQNNGSFWIKQDINKNKLVLPRKQPDQLPFITNSFLLNYIQEISQQGFSTANKEKYQRTISTVRGRPGSVEQVNFSQLIPEPFFDFSFTIQKPYTTKELLEIENPVNCLVLDTSNVYNFYLKSYEEMQIDADETLLPNLYFMEFNNDAADESQQANFQLDPDIPKLLSLNPQQENIPIQTDSYYDLFIEKIQQSSFDDQELLQRAKSIVIPYASIDKVLEKSELISLYPMSIDIRFDGTYNRQISPIIKNNIYGEQIILNCISKFQQQQASLNFVKEEETDSGALFSSQNRYINFQEILDSVGNINDSFVYLGDYSNFNFIVGARTEKEQAKLQLINDVKNRIKNVFRTYKDIFDGKKCYSETLFYKITKYGSDTTTPIQEFYIPNDPDKKNFRYVDTQVKYDKKYTYVIYSYDIVIGNVYSALGNESVFNKAEIYIIENIYDQFEQTVRDLPPSQPHVEIVPYKDVDNKILFLLNKDNFSYKQQEVIIDETDRQFFSVVREAQGLSESEPINFSGDDILKKYILYKTTVPPNSYSDFANAEKIEISTLTNTFGQNARVSSRSLIELIQPNKKYYYTVRCIDIHDQISNPSPVYEVEIINESGTIFPIINVWNFPTEKPRDVTRSLKRFLMIRPSLLNRQITYQTDGVNNLEDLKRNTNLGVQQETPWNKKYKMRIVSKNTGKIYDVNFTFDIKKENITN
jgi:hypothetical protein